MAMTHFTVCATEVHFSWYAIAANNGITKAQAACAADVAINYGLGFIPGYNAAKAAFTLAGGNVNFVRMLWLERAS